MLLLPVSINGLSVGSSISVILWSVILPNEFEEDFCEEDFEIGEEQRLGDDSNGCGFLLYGRSQCIKDLTISR